MKIGNREKILLAMLGVILYGFIFYKVILVNVLPEVRDRKQEISSALDQKALLDKQLKALPNTKAELKTKTVSNEHMLEYLGDGENLIDGIDYIEKLAVLIGKQLSGITVNSPLSVETTGKDKYYELNISFNTILTYEEIRNLIDYIEGGTNKARVVSFKMSPTAKQVKAEASGKFDAAISLSLYSLSNENADKLYEYSRHKFSKFLEGSETAALAANANSKTETGNNKTGSTVNKAAPSKTMSDDVDIAINEPNTGNKVGGSNEDAGTVKDITRCSSVMDSDIAIFEKSFFYPGDNLQVHGIRRPSELMSITTKSMKDVNVNFANDGYTISIKNDSNEVNSISGALLKNDYVRLYVQADFDTNVKENSDLGLNMAISNNSAKKVYITLSDRPGRVKITDRIGNPIVGSNKGEKVYIV